MRYKFRLLIHHPIPGFFHINETQFGFKLGQILNCTVYPRDAEKLVLASKYHIDGNAFDNKDSAKETGEKLRLHLKLLNCLLNLGLTIPIQDEKSASASTGLKEKIRANGIELLDTISGLQVFPDDERYKENVISGNMKNYPSDPEFVFKALNKTWADSFELDEDAQDVLEILNISVFGTSLKVKFLTTYLAVEQLIGREMRREKACKIIDNFVDIIDQSTLDEKERKSLSGTLGSLKEQSFSSAFVSFARKITSPQEIMGLKPNKFASNCISIRNKIAHKADTAKIANLEQYTMELR